MTKQMTNVAMMLVLTLGLMAGAAMAQKDDGGSLAPVGIFTGVESSGGTVDSSGTNIWGNTHDELRRR